MISLKNAFKNSNVPLVGSNVFLTGNILAVEIKFLDSFMIGVLKDRFNIHFLGCCLSLDSKSLCVSFGIYDEFVNDL